MIPLAFTRRLLVLSTVAAFGSPCVAYATPPSMCPDTVEPGVDSVLPADGASGVTTDAWIRVRYTPGYFTPGAAPTESITLTTADGTPVQGRTELVGDRDLFFVPNAPLASDTVYDGVATSSTGFDFSFHTGSTTDTRPPILLAPDSDPDFAVSTAPATIECGIEDGSRRIGITFTSASDDGPAASVEYYLYLTRGTAVTSPELVASARNYSSSTTTLAFVLPPEKLGAVICLSLSAVDGVGHMSTWQNASCFDPVTGTSFYGLCSATPVGNAPSVPPLVLLAACLVVVARRSVSARRRD